jgi:hypothetical protein
MKHRFMGSALLVCAAALLLVGAAAAQKEVETGVKKDAKSDVKKDVKKDAKKDAKKGAEADAKGAAESDAQGEAAPAAEPAATQPPADAPAQAEAPTKSEETGVYTVRLKDLEDRVNRLKEQVFRSKARLSLLAETVLEKKIAGATAVIAFHNEMGASFELAKATFLLDGGAILSKVDENGSLAERDVIELFSGPVVPGEHTLSVVLQYKGSGLGIFSYLKGYSFKVRSSRTFSVNEGKAIKIDIISFEKGNMTTPLEERPAIRYSEGVGDIDSAAPPVEASAGGEAKAAQGSAEGAE